MVRFPSLLVVDDDRHILNFLQMNLEQDGFDVLTAESGQRALELLRQRLPDLALGDLLLPNMHGFEICRAVKSHMDVPVLVLTAVGTEDSVVEGLEKYADDYVVKPFRYREIRARINRLLKRSSQYLPSMNIEVVPGELSLDFTGRLLLLGGREVPLTPTECRLLACLARNSNRVVSQRVLMEEIWPTGEGEPLRLKVVVHRLRAKLEKDPKRPKYLLSERGKGYMLTTA